MLTSNAYTPIFNGKNGVLIFSLITLSSAKQKAIISTFLCCSRYNIILFLFPKIFALLIFGKDKEFWDSFEKKEKIEVDDITCFYDESIVVREDLR